MKSVLDCDRVDLRACGVDGSTSGGADGTSAHPHAIGGQLTAIGSHYVSAGKAGDVTASVRASATSSLGYDAHGAAGFADTEERVGHGYHTRWESWAERTLGGRGHLLEGGSRVHEAAGRSRSGASCSVIWEELSCLLRRSLSRRRRQVKGRQAGWRHTARRLWGIDLATIQ